MRWRLLTTNLIGNLTRSFWAGILFWTEICQDPKWWMSHPGEDIRVLEDLRWWFAASPSCCRSFSDSYWNMFDIFWSHLTSKTREESGRKQIGTNMRTWRIFKLFRSWTVQGVCVCTKFHDISQHLPKSPQKKPRIPGCERPGVAMASTATSGCGFSWARSPATTFHWSRCLRIRWWAWRLRQKP